MGYVVVFFLLLHALIRIVGAGKFLPPLMIQQFPD